VPDEPRRISRPFDIEAVARAVWRGGVDPVGTLTEQYLAELGLPLPDDIRGHFVRHHHSLSFAKDQRLPGMLTLLRDLRDDQAVAVVRTFLGEHAHKITQRIIGRAFRGVAKLDEHVEGTLSVTFGIEAAIRARSIGHRPMWMAASTEAMAALINLPTLAGVETLSILIETGDGNAMRAATAAAARWESTHREARIIEMSKAAS
jgi:hypothetical protein